MLRGRRLLSAFIEAVYEKVANDIASGKIVEYVIDKEQNIAMEFISNRLLRLQSTSSARDHMMNEFIARNETSRQLTCF